MQLCWKWVSCYDRKCGVCGDKIYVKECGFDVVRLSAYGNGVMYGSQLKKSISWNIQILKY
jgi:hypothetical protein